MIENKVKLLDVQNEVNYNFGYHIGQLCKRASKKFQALSILTTFMVIIKRKSLINSVVTSQFSYSHLIWMFHSGNIENRKYRLYKLHIKTIDYTKEVLG